MTTPPDDQIQPFCDEVHRRQRYRRGPQKMADVLSSLLSRRGYAQVQTASACGHAWQQAVGPKLAAHCRPGNVKRGVLEVTVRNSAVMQELMFQKKQLLKKLAQLAAEQNIRDLRFRVGGID